jgi:hypothetical protein
MQNKIKFKKLTKRGKVQNVPRDIGDGDGTIEFMLEQAKAMAQWSSHWNERWHWIWNCACCSLKHLTLECWVNPKIQEGEEEEAL